MAVAPHCSADGSGVTEWISNVTRIAPPSGEDPRPWLTPIASGNGRVLTFLHEATHNWCFNSAVVNAQIHVAGRAQLNALAYLMLQDDPDLTGHDPSDELPERVKLQVMGEVMRALGGDPRVALGDEVPAVRDQLGLHVHDDVIRLEVVNELFRPLAEGLALFAEYDAVSRFRSRAWSPLPLAVAWNFAGRERYEAEARRGFVEPLSTTRIYGEVLEKARLSEWAVMTKATLLRGPFSSTRGGYLPGYLAVKSMWRNLFRQDSRLYGESDIVLAYVRSFFFEDMKMAAEILAPPINNCIMTANRILSCFNARMDEIFEATPADLAAFEAALDSDDPVASTGQLRTPAEHDRALKLIEQRLDEFRTSTAARVSRFALDMAISSVNSLMALRHFVTVLSVDVEVDEHGTVSWQGHDVFTVAPEDVVRPATGPHTLDILLGMSGNETFSRVAVVSSDKELHSVTVIVGLSDQRQALRTSLLESFASRRRREQMARNLQFSGDAIVAEDWGLRANRHHVQSHLRSVVDRVYHDTALRYSSGYEAMDRCGKLMADHGLRPLLGSTDDLRQVALLGLAAGLNSYRDELERQFQRRGLDLSTLLETLRRSWAEHGFPPRIHESNGLLIPFL